MNILEKLVAAANAVKAGEQLKDSTKWKNITLLMGPVGIILGIIVNFVGLPFDEQAISAINYGLCTLAVGLYSYFTAATSDKVGLQGKDSK